VLNKTFYLDPLFDLYLGNYSVDKVKKSASEMGVLFYPFCSADDTLLLDIDIADDYSTYLESKGLNRPALILRKTEDNLLPRSTGVAWGWVKPSENRLLGCNAICDKPDDLIISKINNRKFCNEIGLKYNLGVPGSVFCESEADYLHAVNALKDKYPLVIKPAFGGSGYGIRVINKAEEVSLHNKYVEFYCEHGGFVVEPWCERLYDLSTNCIIEKNGNIALVRNQRLFSNSHGSFFGIYCAPVDHILNDWVDALEKAAIFAAGEIAETGYFGPVGFDSFVYNSINGEVMLAPVIEINGRHVMSHVTHNIRNQIAPDKYCFMRMISKKRAILPATYKELNSLLNGINGVVLLTPLRVRHDHDWVQPSRAALFISADSEKELFETDRMVRLRIEKQ